MTHDPRELLADYPVVAEFPVQWGDQDAFGHVNNLVYFRWFESARITYFERIGVLDIQAKTNTAIILASIQCDYRKQLTYPDRIFVGASVTRIGNSSMTVKHAIVSESNCDIAAQSESIVVFYDYQNQQSLRVPDELRQKIAKLEGRGCAFDTGAET